jgi:hypothetical protein
MKKIHKPVYEYFAKNIAPLIRMGVSQMDVECSLKNNFEGRYKYFLRKHEDTIRVSACDQKSGEIIHLAETKSGKVDFKFESPSYEWRKIR